jgi:hypothetical protein
LIDRGAVGERLTTSSARLWVWAADEMPEELSVHVSIAIEERSAKEQPSLSVKPSAQAADDTREVRLADVLVAPSAAADSRQFFSVRL